MEVSYWRRRRLDIFVREIFSIIFLFEQREYVVLHRLVLIFYKLGLETGRKTVSKCTVLHCITMHLLFLSVVTLLSPALELCDSRTTHCGVVEAHLIFFPSAVRNGICKNRQKEFFTKSHSCSYFKGLPCKFLPVSIFSHLILRAKLWNRLIIILECLSKDLYSFTGGNQYNCLCLVVLFLVHLLILTKQPLFSVHQ